MVGLVSLAHPPTLARAKGERPGIVAYSGFVPRRHRYFGRVATTDGSRGFQPTVCESAHILLRRVATTEHFQSSLRDERGDRMPQTVG